MFYWFVCAFLSFHVCNFPVKFKKTGNFITDQTFYIMVLKTNIRLDIGEVKYIKLIIDNIMLKDRN